MNSTSTTHIGALIPVRLASERLSGKALREICGRPALYHLLDRVCASRHLQPNRVIVCTTVDESDDLLVTAVEDYGCATFRGSRDDLIKRLHDAIESYQFDAVIQVDGDDILCDPFYMDATMDLLIGDRSLDIVTCQGLPLGVASKSFTASAMRRVYQHYRTQQNDTGFSYFFTRTGLCNVGVIRPFSSDHVLDEARLTLDYEEDLAVFRKILEALYVPGTIPAGLADVVRFLRSQPAIMSLNQSLDDEYWERTRKKAQLEFVDPAGEVKRIT